MAVVAGDLREINVKHPELGSRNFEAKAGEDFTYQKGGLKSNDDDGNIGVNLTRIDQMNAYPWSSEFTILNKSGDDEFLQALMENPVESVWTFSHLSGDVQKGTGKPVGDIAPNAQAGTIPVKCAGSGRLEDIA
jgi:hypothetical protein